MRRKFILTDLDDTILEFSKCFQDWSVGLGYQPTGDMREVGCIGTVLGIDDQTTWDLIDDFYRSDEFARLTPEPCALEVLPRLRQAGYQFVAITACADDQEVVRKREANLRNAFGFDFYHVHCTGVRQSKDKYLWTYEPTIWVEDNFGHALKGAEIGHQSLLLDRDYNRNRDHPSVMRINTWKEIEAMLAG